MTINNAFTRGFFAALLISLAIALSGCSPLGSSARAGFERGKFAGAAAVDLERTAAEADKLIAIYQERDAVARRTAVELEYSSAADEIIAKGQMTPDIARRLMRSYSDATARLTADLFADRVTAGKITAKIRAGSTDIETLLRATDMERAAASEVNSFLVNEILPSATAEITDAAATAAARREADRRSAEMWNRWAAAQNPEDGGAEPPAVDIPDASATERR